MLLICILLALPISYPRWLRILKAPFEPFLTTEEAEDIIHQSEHTHEPLRVSRSRVRQTTPRKKLLIAVSVAEAACGFVGSIAAFIVLDVSHISLVRWFDAIAVNASWLYIAIKAYARPTTTPPYDIFTLLVTHFSFTFLSLATGVYAHYSNGEDRHLPPIWPAVPQCVIIGALLVQILNMPIGLPSPYALHEKNVRLLHYDQFNWLMRLSGWDSCQ